MMLLQNRYARWLNRNRRRDGPLWRGRFLSKIVESQEYWHILLRYIDHNPVVAGIVERLELYAHGSASYYTDRRSMEAGGPVWLCRSAVERHVASLAPGCVDSPEAYRRVLGMPLSKSAQRMIDEHGFRRDRVDARFDDLVRAAPESVQRWMERKAQVADGAGLRQTWLLDPDVLIKAIDEAARSELDWAISCGRGSISAWSLLQRSQLYLASGCSLEEAARRSDCSVSSVRRSLAIHARLMAKDETYQVVAVEMLSRLSGREYSWARSGKGRRSPDR